MTDTDIPGNRDKIAIVGIGCRLPGGASDHRAYWRNLAEGKDCITDTPADRYDIGTLGSRDRHKPGRLVGGRGGYIDGFDEFDPAFFGISPREAEHMDPQQRKLLEVAWEALEDGGQKPLDLAGSQVGVFVGAFTLDYKILQFADLGFRTLAAHTATGTMMTMVSNRISYCFDFRGPSLSVDTACSSSLVAVHLASESLRRGETDLALAGGTLLHLTPQYTIAESKGGFLSPEGRSRAFDAAANGYVRAEGVGVVALKRLDDALRDGDPIHAVVLASGVNQDGRTNGITVPNPQAQLSLIQRVCGEAGIQPGSLQYVEAHGTSTPVGDPIEANALGQALAIGRRPGEKCYVGSVKTNIGHTESAAGIAGLIKTALALKHRQIPPHLNFEQANPAIDLDALPFDIPTRLTDWPEHEGPARAGVNSFGFGGTNAHVLLEEAPAREAAAPAPPREGHTVLPLTARDPAVLPELARRIRAELDTAEPADVAHTLAHHRQHLDSRLSIVYSTADELRERLDAYLRGEAHPQVLTGTREDRQPVWVFTGMGPQWWAMGRELFEREPVYRTVIEQCDRLIQQLAGWSLIEHLNAPEAESQMAETWLAQPANFALQIGLAALWRAHGVQPAAIVGHSTGEIAAFYEAGVYTLADAVTVAVHRSSLQQKLIGTGTMLAVSLTETEALAVVAPYGDRASVAAINSPTAITLAGDADALAEIAEALQAKEVFAKFLTVGVPYHSARMELIKDELLAALAGITPRRTGVPLYLTATKANAHGAELDAEYWWHNVRDSVYFHAAVERLAQDGHTLFLEIGPHPVLAHSIRESLAALEVQGHTVPSIRRNEDERARFTMSLAELHNHGVEIDWNLLHPAGEQVPLPCYPWKRDRYWVEPQPVAQVRLGRQDHPLLGRRRAGAEPVWEADLDLEHLPYLSDHQIQGSAVFPAAGYLEMMAQAVRTLTGSSGAVTLGGIELRRALVLAESESSTVQLSFAAEHGTCTIATPSGDGQDPVVHARGTVHTGQTRDLGPAPDLDRIRARTRRLDGPDCYARLAELGYDYGPAFQGIEQVWIGPGEALALIRPTEAIEAAGHHVHPALLDACFQTLLTPQLLQGRTTAGIRLPLGIEEVRLTELGDQPFWAHATVTSEDGGELRGDLALHAEDGRPLGRITGFRAADIEAAATSAGLATIDGWLAEPAWIPAPPTETGDTPALLVLADDGGLGAELAAQVRAAGGYCHLVHRANGYHRGAEESLVRPDSAEDLGLLLAELDVDGVRLDAVVHLWNLDLPGLEDAESHAFPGYTTDGAYSLIALAQSLGSIKDGTRLHIVTRGAQAVEPGAAAAPLAAPAWGIGRVLRHQELTACHGKLIDLDPTALEDVRAEAAALLREIAAPSGEEDEIALRGGERFQHRLAPATGLRRPLPPRLRADGSYLVTGAFGALGRLVCRTLIRRGARRLILVGRSPVPEREQWQDTDPASAAGQRVAFLRELEALGAHPEVAALDITDEAAFTGWLARHRRGAAPPIRGVFHLAGTVRDTLLAEMDRAAFDAAHGPKVLGAHLLHRHLRDEPLDHFVLFASIASLLTTAGQTNYAAGNAFLDALAHHRRAQGLPALSIDWGPWAIGMISELGLIEHYRNSRGMTSLSPEAGMAVLERVLGQEHPQLVVATVVDWPLFLAWYPAPPPLLAELASAAESGTSATGHFLDDFAAADDHAREQLVAEQLGALISGVLRVGPDQVDPAESLLALGMDSLLAMELRARIHTELRTALPVVTLLSGAPIGELAAQVRTNLTALVSAEDGEGSGTEVEIWTDEHRYPLTQNQQALWFLKQLHPEGFAYNIGGAVEVRVELEPELMFQAFAAVVARHPSLRANFTHELGKPVQLISAEVRTDTALFEVQDLAWPDIYQMIIAEYREPYDLQRDPLIRLRLFKRGPDRWVIVKAVHHIISDAISTFTFIEELLETYEGLRQGRRTELPPLPARYLDFLNWQNQFLASPEAERMLAYWRGHLPAEVPVLALPTDKPRPAVQTHNGASEFFALDPDLSARVHALAAEHRTTVFVVLMAAYYLLLHRYSGQDDVIIGSPVTGRTQEDFGSVYGYFVNPLPLHVNLSGTPSVGELLAQVRTTVLNGLDNQEYPFVLLVDELGLPHDPSRSAVFQAMFILLHHRVATEKHGYRLDYIELPEEEGQFDLTLSVYEDEAAEQFRCVFKYNTDLFEPATVQRLTGHYRTLLDALTHAEHEVPVAALDMLAGPERTRILTEFSGADCAVEAGLPVHELIGRAAAAQPQAIAVVAPAEDGTRRELSYGELDRRSRALAKRLRGRGAGAGAVVALCLDKSPELVIAVLAVLRAGAAYLPVDPGYPERRRAYMIEHAGAALVLTAADLAELEAEPVPSVREAALDLDSAAYVIYTSGSTGRPKAVRVSHRNLASAYAAWRTEYQLGTDVRVHLQLASFSFDVFTGDLVRALCSGGRLVLLSRELMFNTARLHQTMVDERVDCVEFVPAIVRGLMDHCEKQGKRLDFLRLLIVGSDAWKVSEYQRLRELAGPGTRVVNSYGLTEATIDSSTFEGPVDGLDPGALVPIGAPLPGSAFYLLDHRGEPVPPGVPGELWIGGSGVASGYLGDPELTEERFRTLDLGQGPVRLYRTGDLAHWDAQGRAHLLGRADAQIKVRGHRIETGEVEIRLLAWPALAQTVVAARADERDETVLCAYCVPEPGQRLDFGALRRHLAEYLPTFMIPSYFAELTALPLTANGKVDQEALPLPRLEERQRELEPPVTLYERRLAEHWKSLLGLAEVGLGEDFFAAGGSSIKLIELIHHLQAEFNLTIPVSQLFKVTTLQGMATTLEHIITGRIAGAEPYLTFNPQSSGPLFCFPPAGGHGLVYRELALRLPEHRFIAFNYLPGAAKVAGYADLVESLHPEGPCALFGYSLGGNLAFEVAKELESRGREVTEVIIMDSYRVPESFEPGPEHLAAFELELREHLLRHTGSSTVAAETLAQAREYIGFSSQTPNLGVVAAAVTVISDAHKVPLYAEGAHGSWQRSSASASAVLPGSGAHADMLDGEHLEVNAGLLRQVLAGQSSGRKLAQAEPTPGW